jgi:hypothetical protein
MAAPPLPGGQQLSSVAAQRYRADTISPPPGRQRHQSQSNEQGPRAADALALARFWAVNLDDREEAMIPYTPEFAKKYAPAVKGGLKLYFHTHQTDEQGERRIEWQGYLITLNADGTGKAQIFSWLTGDPTNTVPVTPTLLANGHFYLTHEEWIDTANHPELQCRLFRAVLDHATHVVTLYLDENNSTNMRGAIRFARRLDPYVTRVETFAANAPDAFYVRSENGDKWRFEDHRIPFMGTCGDWVPEEELRP